MINYNLNANNYYSYMRQLAASHTAIGNDNSVENRKHFFIGEMEDFYKGLRSVVEFPALVVEGFQLNLDEWQETLYRESAFTVVFDYNDHDNSAQQTDCFSQSEDIGREILRRIAADGDESLCPIRINNIAGVQVLNETDRYAGIRFSFSIYSANVTDINEDAWNKTVSG